MTKEDYINGTGGLIDYNYSGPLKKGVSYLGSKKTNKNSRIRFIESLTPEVASQYLEYPTDADFLTQDDCYDLKNNYFVYDICTIDGKVLFVEKSNDPNFKFNYKYDSLISFLSERVQFSLRRLIDGINEFQAIVYIQSKIMEYATRGEYLLNYYFFEITEPEVSRPSVTGSEPAFVFKNPAIKRFLPDIYEKEEKFDIVNEEVLSHVTFHSKQKLEIVEWLNASGFKITKTCTNNTKGIIVDNWIDYIPFVKYKRIGKEILAVDDVLDYIKKHPVTKTVCKKQVKVPSYDVTLRDEIRLFLNKNKDQLLKYERYINNHLHDLDVWLNPFGCEILKDYQPKDYLENYIVDIIHYKIITQRNPHTFYDMIKVYKKLGLFDEIVQFLSGIKDLAGAELVKYEMIAESDRQ